MRRAIPLASSSRTALAMPFSNCMSARSCCFTDNSRMASKMSFLSVRRGGYWEAKVLAGPFEDLWEQGGEVLGGQGVHQLDQRAGRPRRRIDVFVVDGGNSPDGLPCFVWAAIVLARAVMASITAKHRLMTFSISCGLCAPTSPSGTPP